MYIVSQPGWRRGSSLTTMWKERWPEDAGEEYKEIESLKKHDLGAKQGHEEEEEVWEYHNE